MAGAAAPDDRRVLIFDTTLRDGEQTPGATLTVEEKVEIAQALAELGVDVLEAGFPASSPGDLKAVRRIAAEVQGPVIAGLARANEGDIRACWQAVSPASRPRIHTFIATSDIHLSHKLRLSRAECLQAIQTAVRLARDLCPDVEFSPEDATRSQPSFLVEAVAVAAEAGATTVNIPDTVGYATPGEFGRLIAQVRQSLPEGAIVSVHCHDDLGLAVANSLAGVEAGARQVECTINGLGERAGNASLEEIVMTLKVREAYYGLGTGIDSRRLAPTSRLVALRSGIPVQPNKAVVGANAFAHEAGIHQDGMLKNPLTYEIMRPEDVGLEGSRLVLGKLSGRHAFRIRLAEMGYLLRPEELERAFQRFKELCDRKVPMSPERLEELARAEMSAREEAARWA